MTQISVVCRHLHGDGSPCEHRWAKTRPARAAAEGCTGWVSYLAVCTAPDCGWQEAGPSPASAAVGWDHLLGHRSM